MTDFDPFDVLGDHIGNGHSAAVVVASLGAQKVTVDAAARVKAAYGNEHAIGPILDVADWAARGRLPNELEAPSRNPMYYAGLAVLKCSGNRAVIVAVEDSRGTASGPLSRWQPPTEWVASGTGDMGERLTHAIMRRASAASGRVPKSARQLGPDAPSVLAGAAAERFSKDRDLWQWTIVEARDGTCRVLASSPEPVTGPSPTSAWVRALEEAAGMERHQHRGQPVKHIAHDLSTRPASADPAIEQIELADLIGRAGLSDRESEVLALVVADSDSGEYDSAAIGTRLGIAASTVRNLLASARRKIRSVA